MDCPGKRSGRVERRDHGFRPGGSHGRGLRGAAEGRTFCSPGGEAAIIESVKAAFSIYAPVAGTIVAVNPDLDSDPGLLNRDPYGKGWIFRLKAVQPEEIPVLMDEGAYQKFLKEGGGHPEHG